MPKKQFPYLLRRTIFAAVAVVCCVPRPLSARLTRHWTYQEMFDRADIVVIARVESSSETGDRTTLPEYNPALSVVGVLTTFEIRLILKGPKGIKTFQLYHYRYVSQDDEFAMSNTPFLLDIKPGRQPTFLLFLSKDGHGKYVPVSGQTDPAFLSVLELEAGAD